MLGVNAKQFSSCYRHVLYSDVVKNGKSLKILDAKLEDLQYQLNIFGLYFNSFCSISLKLCVVCI